MLPTLKYYLVIYMGIEYTFPFQNKHKNDDFFERGMILCAILGNGKISTKLNKPS